MADIFALLADPRFQGLDVPSQRTTLARVTGDDRFSRLSDGEVAEFRDKTLAPAGKFPSDAHMRYVSGITGKQDPAEAPGTPLPPSKLKQDHPIIYNTLGTMLPFPGEMSVGSPGPLIDRGVTVAAKTAKNLFNNPSGLEKEAETGSRVAKALAKVKDAYRRADISTPDPDLKASTAARAPGRVEPQPQEFPDLTPIQGNLPSGRKVGPVAAPAPKPPRPAAARVDVSTAPIPDATPIPPPSGKLPSGRTPGGIANQKPATAPAVNVGVPTAEEIATAKNLGGDFSTMTPAQQQFVRDAVAKSKVPATVPAKAPAVDMEHYSQTGQSFGTRMAQHATEKDATIIRHLQSNGLTPEAFEALPTPVKNDWIAKVNAATGKKYEYYRGAQGDSSAARLLKTWRYLKGPTQ